MFMLIFARLFRAKCHAFDAKYIIYIVLTLCEHACKTVCDVKTGIDPFPSTARS